MLMINRVSLSLFLPYRRCVFATVNDFELLSKHWGFDAVESDTIIIFIFLLSVIIIFKFLFTNRKSCPFSIFN